MINKLVRVPRTIAALLLAGATATGPGCHMIRRITPHFGEVAAPVIDPAQQRDVLRERRQLAWVEMLGGHSPREFSARDALELSRVEQAFDAQTTWTTKPVPGRATLEDLPRAYWWYLFTDPRDWSRGPLAADNDGAPGSYAAMMNAFDQVLVGATRTAVGPDDYVAMHALVTLGVFHKDRGGPEALGFAHEPQSFVIAPLHDPDATRRELLAAGLAEMKAEGLASWNPELQKAQNSERMVPWLAEVLATATDPTPYNKPARLIYVRDRDASGAPQFGQWLRGYNDYRPGEASHWVGLWLKSYGEELQKLTARKDGSAYLQELGAGGEPSEVLLAMARPVARLIRRLQVSHVFAAGNDQLNARLLLDKLLVAQGLPPTVIMDTSLFAGRVPLDHLAREVIRGQLRFQALVTELAARDAMRTVAVASPETK